MAWYVSHLKPPVLKWRFFFNPLANQHSYGHEHSYGWINDQNVHVQQLRTYQQRDFSIGFYKFLCVLSGLELWIRTESSNMATGKSSFFIRKPTSLDITWHQVTAVDSRRFGSGGSDSTGSRDRPISWPEKMLHWSAWTSASSIVVFNDLQCGSPM